MKGVFFVNVPMSWMKEYAPVTCDIQTFIDGMTLSGSKVEAVEILGEQISNVVVGKILSIERHPDADKLVITQVDIGKEEPIQIVTGADNISVGDYIPTALHGATLPGGVKIKTGKLRGIESQGMMCSVQEMGFEPADFPEAPAHGIYIFPEAQSVGIDAKPLFGLDDAVVEYEITSNRPDCFSVLGIAREAAATFDVPFGYPEIHVQETGEKVEEFISVEIQNPKLCPRYAARIVKNVKIEPSPKWMRQRLLAVGIRPINNIVDITNYVMVEMGQPMHAFDITTVEEGKIIVRNAEEGESFITLDKVKRKLDASMMVIADGKKALAVAGVMGGENSMITETANTILFESANFHGANVRVTAKKLGLRTDASSKFEKGLDPNQVVDALNRAVQLVVELGAGEVVGGIVDCYPNKREPQKISYAPERVNNLLGTTISEKEMVALLEKLEIKVDTASKTATIPTFRPDVEREADLAEEVARLYGYDKIVPTLAVGTPTVGKKNDKQMMEDRIKEIMTAQGLSEAMTYSFESLKVFDKLMIPKDHALRDAIIIANPLGEDFSVMRTTTLGGMLQSLSTNYNRRNEEAGLFELAPIYLPKELPLVDLPDERMQLTVGMYGKIDYYDLKGIMEELFDGAGIASKIEYHKKTDLPWMHPGRCAAVTINGQYMGYLGELHPQVADHYDIGTKVYMAVLDLPVLIEASTMDRIYKPLPKYPAVSRDIAMLVKDEVLVKEIESIIKQRGGKILESFTLFDVYKGKQIEEGYKSVAYAITFRAEDRTLTDEDVNTTMKKILNGLEREVGAQLRDK